MALTTAALERAGIDLPLDAFERMVVEAAEQMLPPAPASDARRALSAEEAGALARGGLDASPYRGGADDPLARTAAEYAAILATSLSVGEAARRLGVKESRIRQRLGERTLYGVKLRAGWRLPRFQFADRGLVPGLERVLPRLDPELHPVELLAWLVTPAVDLPLGDDEAPTAPIDWLRAGHPPESVATLAAEL